MSNLSAVRGMGIFLLIIGVLMFIADFLAGVFGMSFIGIILLIFGVLFLITPYDAEERSRRQ